MCLARSRCPTEVKWVRDKPKESVCLPGGWSGVAAATGSRSPLLPSLPLQHIAVPFLGLHFLLCVRVEWRLGLPPALTPWPFFTPQATGSEDPADQH